MLWLLLFLLWPLAELFVIVKVAEAIGFFWMLVLLLASWPLGTRILRSRGRSAVQRVRHAISRGRTPADEAIDGALLVSGGLLLLIPGFITDVIGLLLLAGPVRDRLGQRIGEHVRSGPLRRVVEFWGRGRQNYDADATAIDLDEPQLNP